LVIIITVLQSSGNNTGVDSRPSGKGPSDDLLTVDKLMGRTRRQVIDLLGQPDERTSRYFQYVDPNAYSPNLRKVIVLRLRFDDEGKVIGVEYNDKRR
jgi:hypothetical protein